MPKTKPGANRSPLYNRRYSRFVNLSNLCPNRYDERHFVCHNLRGNNVLDFGCNNGDNTERIREMSGRPMIYGYEVNPEARAMGEANHPDVCYLSRVAHGSMDSVYSTHVMEHIKDEDIPYAFRFINRILRPRGRLIIVVPYTRLTDLPTQSYNLVRGYSNPHVQHFKPDSLTALAGRFGFEPASDVYPLFFWGAIPISFGAVFEKARSVE